MNGSLNGIGPCPFALAASTVPAKRWRTRADLIAQLSDSVSYMDVCELEGFRVTCAAEASNLSVYHFVRLFREVYGITAYQYVANRRVQAAKALLDKGSMSIVEIALEVGFNNASAFSRAFRLATGMSPRAYRSAGKCPASLNIQGD